MRPPLHGWRSAGLSAMHSSKERALTRYSFFSRGFRLRAAEFMQ
jgi:hypothetical protein